MAAFHALLQGSRLHTQAVCRGILS
uniref:Uncharacterized protein n=1 Tax=Anguilla anguilla TaxID=7936 RepID=A0A0E9P6D3_ANGAN